MTSEEIHTLRLVVKSPAGLLFEKSGLLSVQIDLLDGKIGIRPGHAPLIAEVAAGEIAMEDGQNTTLTSVQPGIMVVQEDLINIYSPALNDSKEDVLEAGPSSEEEFDQLLDAVMSTLHLGISSDDAAQI